MCGRRVSNGRGSGVLISCLYGRAYDDLLAFIAGTYLQPASDDLLTYLQASTLISY